MNANISDYPEFVVELLKELEDNTTTWTNGNGGGGGMPLCDLSAMAEDNQKSN